MKILIALLIAACLSAQADTITLCVANTAATNYYVPAGVAASVVCAECSVGSCRLLLAIGGTTNLLAAGYGNSQPSFQPSNMTHIFAGPATLILTNSINGTTAPAFSFCTIQTSPAIPAPVIQTPGTAVVIPSDTAGPVTIILESSTDLVSWTDALPGTYGTTASNRFFRVRASR